jgi:hypothetical protein
MPVALCGLNSNLPGLAPGFSPVQQGHSLWVCLEHARSKIYDWTAMVATGFSLLLWFLEFLDFIRETADCIRNTAELSSLFREKTKYFAASS